MKLNYPEISHIYQKILEQFDIINWEIDNGVDEAIISLLWMEVKLSTHDFSHLVLKIDLIYQDLYLLNRERKLKKLKKDFDKKRKC